MFDTVPLGQINDLLQNFAVPMFIVERFTPGGEFVLICCNAEMEKLFGLTRGEILGCSPRNFTRNETAGTLARKFALCVEKGCEMRFRETLDVMGRQQPVDFALKSHKGPAQSERVVGVVTISRPSNRNTAGKLVLDDVKYFSQIAEFQLQNLIWVFESSEDPQLFTEQNRIRVEKLSGMCRSVQRAIADIRNVAASCDAEIDPTNLPHPDNARKTTTCEGDADLNSDVRTINALHRSMKEWNVESPH